MTEVLKKIISALIFLSIISCKKNEKLISNKDQLVLDGKALITENINVLVDSVASFDLRFMNKNSKSEKLTVGLIDTILYCNGKLNTSGMNCLNDLSLKLKDSDVINFKSPYKLKLVKGNNYEDNVLFITFSSFGIEGDRAHIDVKKVFGISMMQATFYFKKKNGTWVFERKSNSGAIG